MKYFFFFFFVQSLAINAQIKKNEYNLNYDKHLYFNVFFEDTKTNANIVFDTGASSLYLDTLFYKKENFTHENIMKAVIGGIGTKKKTVDVVLDSITFNIGESKFNSTLTPLLDLKSILGFKADGIFGLNFFQDKAIELDYITDKLKVYDSITIEDFSGFKCVPLFIEKNRLFTNCKIWITETKYLEGKFIIDTGTPDALILNSGVLDEDEIVNKSEYESFEGLGGASYGYTFILKAFEIESFRLKKIITDISTDKTGALSNKDYNGIIGNGILEKFHVIFDLNNNSLYLKPNNRYNNSFEKPKVGFSFSNRNDIGNGWIVNSIYLDSQAAKKGLLVKDKIVKVNDTSVKKLQDNWFKTNVKHSSQISLEIIRNGELINIDFTPNEIIK